MTIANASPRLYNEDLAPARERNWGAFSIFNVWTSDVHSLWGYYLAASLFLICGNFVNFIVAIGIGSLVIFVLMTLVGFAGVKTGVPYPVLARASFGTFGANLPALVRAVVACFWYGAQTSAASGAIVALLAAQQRDRRIQQEFASPRSHDPGDDHLHHRVGAPAPHHSARHGDGAAVPGLGGSGGVGDDADPRHLPQRQGRRDFVRQRDSARRADPEDSRRRRSLRAGIFCCACRGCGDMDHLFRRALPQFLRLLALSRRTSRRSGPAMSGACRSTSSCSRSWPASRPRRLTPSTTRPCCTRTRFRRASTTGSWRCWPR